MRNLQPNTRTTRQPKIDWMQIMSFAEETNNYDEVVNKLGPDEDDDENDEQAYDISDDPILDIPDDEDINEDDFDEESLMD